MEMYNFFTEKFKDQDHYETEVMKLLVKLGFYVYSHSKEHNHVCVNNNTQYKYRIDLPSFDKNEDFTMVVFSHTDKDFQEVYTFKYLVDLIIKMSFYGSKLIYENETEQKLVEDSLKVLLKEGYLISNLAYVPHGEYRMAYIFWGYKKCHYLKIYPKHRRPIKITTDYIDYIGEPYEYKSVSEFLYKPFFSYASNRTSSPSGVEMKTKEIVQKYMIVFKYTDLEGVRQRINLSLYGDKEEAEKQLKNIEEWFEFAYKDYRYKRNRFVDEAGRKELLERILKHRKMYLNKDLIYPIYTKWDSYKDKEFELESINEMCVITR